MSPFKFFPRRSFPLFVALLTLWLAACSTRRDAPPARMTSGVSGAERADVSAAPGEHEVASNGSSAVTDATSPGTSMEGAAEMAVTGDGRDRQRGGRADAMISRRAGQLTAGEWSDLEHWDFWTKLTRESEFDSLPSYWGIMPSQRVSVVVKHGNAPARDTRVLLKDRQGDVVWEARSDNEGRAELFGGLSGKEQGPYNVQVEGVSVPARGVDANNGGAVVIDLLHGGATSNTLDLMFVTDATGSMGDEMEYIKTELRDVIERVRNANGADLQIRLSCNFYRDHGDDYIVRSFPFTGNIDEVVEQISRQNADGGGDYEEAMEEGLEDAVMEHEWSTDARARLLFLVLDAPPHHTPDRIAKLQRIIAEASKRGIRIIPVASSGVDKPTEFLLRLLGITTGATYTFLTDDSGIGDSHLKPTIGPYRVEYLNDLLVRLIDRYTAVRDIAVTRGVERPSFR